MEREERSTMSAGRGTERLTAHGPDEDDIRIVEGVAG
jgi:hypothetical protein